MQTGGSGIWWSTAGVCCLPDAQYRYHGVSVLPLCADTVEKLDG